MSLPTDTMPTILRVMQAMVVGTTIFVAGGLANTSLQSLPTLVLATKEGRSLQNAGGQDEGRPYGYGIAVKQFKLLSDSAKITQVPLQALVVLASGYLAYRTRGDSTRIWERWAAASALVAAIFPLSAMFMEPLVLEILSLPGSEQHQILKDTPSDSETDRAAAEKCMRQLGKLNAIRTGLMTIAGGIGLWSLVD